MTASSQSAVTSTQLEGRVLVVDDDEGLVDTLCDILSLAGVDATGVGSARAAIDWCAVQAPDLVVLDQRLPDASGLQLAAQLKAINPLLPVVLLTGYVSTDSAIAAVGLVDEYLTKPVPPNDLIKVVQTRLEQHRLRVSNRALLEQLQEANNRLEQTVEERTRELMTARDQAMEASRLKSQFLANMSHELRTPMNGVIGAADLMARTVLTDEQRGYVQILSSSSHSLLAVINDVLDFSKIEADRLELDSSPFDLPEVFAAVVSMLTTQASAKGVALTLDVDPATPQLVVGDGLRVRQIATNLVGNAVKFTDAGSVRVKVGVAATTDAPPSVRCEVTDTGIGIREEDVPRLFHDFTQVDISNSRRYGGTGLGLAISDRLVRLMGGAIGCTPNPGGGTTFWFTVPFAAAPAPAQPVVRQSTSGPAASSGASPAGEGPLLLIVEDNPTNALLLQRMLAILGYRNETVNSGADALLAIARTRFAAVLMDCQMPVMDGFTTTEAIRAREDGEHRVPIIAITATATIEDQQRCLAAGMDDYVSKPIMVDRLAQAVNQWAPRE